MAVMSSYYWSGFPFDNLCENEDQQPPANYIGDHKVPVLKANIAASIVESWSGRPEDQPESIDHIETFTIEPNATTYTYCNQNFFASGSWTFPFIPKWQPEGEEWMTDQQETVTKVYGWTTVALIIAFFIFFSYKIVAWFCSYFYGHYQVSGRASALGFGWPFRPIMLILLPHPSPFSRLGTTKERISVNWSQQAYIL
jgi:hypothetical protein